MTGSAPEAADTERAPSNVLLFGLSLNVLAVLLSALVFPVDSTARFLRLAGMDKESTDGGVVT